MIDFLILYEHKVRELDNICLIRAELEKRGYTVEFHQIDALKRIKYFLHKKPKVIMGTALGNDKRINDYIYSTVGSINKIVNLQLEQVISKKWEGSKVFIPTGDGLKITNVCWGKERYERLKNLGAKNSIITGAIQTDYFRKEFCDYFLSKELIYKQYQLDMRKKTILYISSFSPTTMTKEEYEYFEKMGGVRLDDLRDCFMNSKKETLKWIKAFLTQKKDVTFIYRPHPSEKEDKGLISMKEQFPNFRIISDLSVKQWILVSDKIYTWISTSIIEVFFASKNCNIVRPFKISEVLDIPFYKNSKHINSLEEFIESIDRNDVEFPILKEEIDYRYDYSKELPSFIRICDLLEDVYSTNQYDIKPGIKYRMLLKSYLRAILQEIIYRLELLNPEKINKIPINKVREYLIGLNRSGNKFGNKEFLTDEEIEETMGKSRRVVERY